SVSSPTPPTRYLDHCSSVPLANWDSNSNRPDLSKGVFFVAFAPAHPEIRPIPWRKAQ
ncbi:hypothetical protein PISMIDRAFT_678469, partial [Pisolithus microcarpus 441]